MKHIEDVRRLVRGIYEGQRNRRFLPLFIRILVEKMKEFEIRVDTGVVSM